MARKHPTAKERAILMDILKANGLGPCNHPDCDPKQPSCATNYVHLRAYDAVKIAYWSGLKRSSVKERDAHE
jgi:hypothetical protein